MSIFITFNKIMSLKEPSCSIEHLLSLIKLIKIKYITILLLLKLYLNNLTT